jgi:hypothetical protein
MIKRSQTLDDNPIPISSFTLEVGHRSKNELDRTIESFHNTHMRPQNPNLPQNSYNNVGIFFQT